ncbi:MAG: M18 family aminopeptidase [Lachnospiraceae bacterium]|nr:M18 family aminopeptidase [Lachnospiraceae bacterium]
MTELIDYLKAAKSPYHAVEFAAGKLKEAGFENLDFTKEFELKEGGKYYCVPYPTALFAFKVNKADAENGMHIACAHTDSPTFRIKPNPDMKSAGINKLNVEPYGGMLKRTWFDRGLGAAGTVLLRTEDPYNPKAVLFDTENPWFIIPSLAPHMDREIESRSLDPQKELLPVFGLVSGAEDEDESFVGLIAEKIGAKKEDILDYDFSLYLCEEPVICGSKGEFLLASRIDNIASVAALTEGIIADAGNDQKDAKLSIIALFDNEEIGSRTKQGADSNILNAIVDRIYESKLFANANKLSDVSRTKILSVDGAHGVHPNYAEKADDTAKALMGKGVVFKTSASQRYVTDPAMGAILKALCEKNDIPFSRQANKSGAPGGQTLGPIISSYLPVPAADLGVPMLGMHSVKETMCIKDYEALFKLMNIWLQ